MRLSALVLLCAAGVALVAHRGVAVGLPPADDDEPQWDNELEDPVLEDCPCGYALHRVRSEFSTAVDDARWDWECVKICGDLVKNNCEWYTANELRKTMIFRCPKRQFMAGIRSSIPPGENDRVWEVKCCEVPGKICPTNCFLTGYVTSTTDYNTDYCAGDGGVFVGLVSDFILSFSGRAWKIEECAATECQLFPGIELEDDKEYLDDEKYEEYQ